MSTRPNEAQPTVTEGPRPRAVYWLVATAFAIKVVYLAQYVALPIIDGPAFDSLAYLRQAEAIRAGRFGDASLLAFSPLYGYVLALCGAPGSLVGVVVLQLVVGSLNLLLVWDIAARCFGRREAFVSASLYLGYGLLAFYETKILAETLGLSLCLVALRLMTRPRFIRGGVGTAGAAGAAFALAVLARSNLLLAMPFVPLVALAPWGFGGDESWKPRIRRALGCALGIAIVLVGNGTWNYAHSGLFVPVILRSATASRASQAAWDGTLSSFSVREDGNVGVFDVIEQAEARLRGHTTFTADAAIDVVGVLKGVPRKLHDTFRSVETDFQYGYYGERTEVPVLRLLSVSFGLLCVLSCVGLVAARAIRRLPRLMPLLPFAAGALATTVLFHPSSRYRLPLVLPLLLLAGLGAVWMWNLPRDRRFWILVSSVALVAAYVTYGTVAYQLKDPAMWELRMAESAIAATDAEEAERRISRAQELAGDQLHVQQRIAYLRRRFSGGY